MPNTLTFGRIGSIEVESIRPQTERLSSLADVPGGFGAAWNYGTKSASVSVTCQIRSATAVRTFHQLIEMAENPYGYWEYVQFPTGFTHWDGFYIVNGVNAIEEGYWLSTYAEFELSLTRIGTLGHQRLAIFWWGGASETYTGWGSLTCTRMIALPNGATSVDYATAATRTTVDGTTILLSNPTHQDILFSSDGTVANWWKSECRIYDSMSAGDATEGNWVQVYSPYHKFAGDKVFQNGLLRAIIGASTTTWYVYESVVADAWKSIGTFKTALTGNVDAVTKHVEILKITPDILRWREIRMNGTNRLYLNYTLRRGANHCRVEITTRALGIDTGTYVQLAKTGGFTQLFNPSANGAAGGGNLALDDNDSYECGYNTTDDLVAGFVLLDQPGSQPLDGGANVFPCSLTWAAATTKTIFIIAWAQDTGTWDLPTGRSNAAAIAAHARYSVESEFLPLAAGWDS